MGDFVEKGSNYNVLYALSYIGDKKMEVENYIKECLNDKFVSFQNEEEIRKVFSLGTKEFLEKLSLEERNCLLNYTGLGFRNINAVLRNTWNYQVNGALSPELKKEYTLLGDQIRKVLNKALELPMGIKTYRGVSINAFYAYNISTIQDLKYLENGYLFEDGFTSTSLIKEKCFYYKNPYTLTGKPNILIEYLIPQNSCDGIPLISEESSLAVSQDEFLINRSSLFKVTKVSVDYSNNTAFLQVLLIPEKVWNYSDYIREREAAIKGK